MKNLKFDPDAWVQAGKGNSIPCGNVVHVRLATPGTLEVDIGKGYRLVGYGDEFKITLPAGGRVRSPNSDISVYAGYDVSVEVTEAPFTNFDKRPGDSAVERMIARAFKEKSVKDALARLERKRDDFKAQQKRKQKGIVEDVELPDPDAPPPEPPVVEEPAQE